MSHHFLEVVHSLKKKMTAAKVYELEKQNNSFTTTQKMKERKDDDCLIYRLIVNEMGGESSFHITFTLPQAAEEHSKEGKNKKRGKFVLPMMNNLNQPAGRREMRKRKNEEKRMTLFFKNLKV